MLLWHSWLELIFCLSTGEWHRHGELTRQRTSTRSELARGFHEKRILLSGQWLQDPLKKLETWTNTLEYEMFQMKKQGDINLHFMITATRGAYSFSMEILCISVCLCESFLHWGYSSLFSSFKHVCVLNCARSLYIFWPKNCFPHFPFIPYGGQIDPQGKDLLPFLLQLQILWILSFVCVCENVYILISSVKVLSKLLSPEHTKPAGSFCSSAD